MLFYLFYFYYIYVAVSFKFFIDSVESRIFLINFPFLLCFPQTLSDHRTAASFILQYRYKRRWSPKIPSKYFLKWRKLERHVLSFHTVFSYTCSVVWVHPDLTPILFPSLLHYTGNIRNILPTQFLNFLQVTHIRKQFRKWRLFVSGTNLISSNSSGFCVDLWPLEKLYIEVKIHKHIRKQKEVYSNALGQRLTCMTLRLKSSERLLQ